MKCENTKFEIQKREDELFVYVICAECGTVIGVLEDIDFKWHNNKVINNHVFIERRINELEEKIKYVDKENRHIIEMVENLSNAVGHILEKIS